MKSSIQEIARIHPDRIAIIDGEQHLTYEDFNGLIQNMAAILDNYNVQKGDRIGILSDNSFLFAVIFFAAQRSSFILVPLHRRRTREQWQEQIETVSCKLVLVDDAGEEILRPSRFRIINLKTLETEARKHNAQFQGIDKNKDGDAVIIFTSGSTGTPQPVRLTWRNIDAN